MEAPPVVYETLADLLSVANIVLFTGVAAVSIHDFYRCSKVEGYGWCWLKVAQAIVGLYFALMYAWVLFAAPENYNTINFGRIFVRPAQTVLAGLILSDSIIKSKRGGTFFDLSGLKRKFCPQCRAKEREKNNEC